MRDIINTTIQVEVYLSDQYVFIVWSELVLKLEIAALQPLGFPHFKPLHHLWSQMLLPASCLPLAHEGSTCICFYMLACHLQAETCGIHARNAKITPSTLVCIYTEANFFKKNIDNCYFLPEL
jgi:hypothetical protein